MNIKSMVQISTDEYKRIINAAESKNNVKAITAVVTLGNPDYLVVLLESASAKSVSDFAWDVQMAMNDIADEQLKNISEGCRIINVASIFVDDGNGGLQKFQRFVRNTDIGCNRLVLGEKLI